VRRTCDQCEAPAIAFKPGTAAQTCELLGTTLVVKAGEPCGAWCLEHWPASWVTAPQTEGEISKHFQPKETAHV
jgi:hypothetical protein